MKNDMKQIYNIRYYALGHSFLSHGPFVGWDWADPENGDRGMAASRYDKDYFARFKFYLKQKYPCKIKSYADNIANYERLCVEGMTKEKYKENELYLSIKKRLEEFKPNIVTIYVAENTVSKDDLGLFYDCLFEMVRNAVGDDAIVIAATGSENEKIFKPCKEMAEKYRFIMCHMKFFSPWEERRTNPYYAYMQYPEYDKYIEEYKKEHNGEEPVDFRAHPSDMGMDAIGKSLADAALFVFDQYIQPEYVSDEEFDKLMAEEEKEKKENSASKESEKISCARFDFDTDGCYDGVTFGGFNTFVKDSFLCGNSAPGTSFNVCCYKLDLDGEKYNKFSIVMKVYCDTQEDKTGTLNLTINTENKGYKYSCELVINELNNYEFDISDIKEKITGFSVSPSMLNCNADIDLIEFV